jgi:putative DNA primase/helicase
MPGAHDRKTLLPLAPLSWWEHHFPAKNGVGWAAAADALLRASERMGVFRHERLRGRGCWPETGPDGSRGILVHLGDQLLPPGARAFVNPEAFRSPRRYTYERLHHLEGPSRQPLDLDAARAILDVFQMPLWKDPASAYLAAGWTVLAPICGALEWRPHIFLTGERGCGKSSLLEKLISPLLADMMLSVLGQTTEAGIRQELRADALAVVFDEAEEDEAAGRRIQAVLALARQASSESDARTLKGTVHGGALQFRIRSMFCLASIGGAVYQEADKSRISMLNLRGASQVKPDERHAHWRALSPKLNTISEDTGRDLIARTLGLLRTGVLPTTVKVFRQVAATVLGEARTGDQYGTLYAGAWTLMSDTVPTEAEARELVTAEDLTTYQDDAVPEGRKALGIILQQVERVDTKNGPKSISVGELVDACCGRLGGGASAEEADARLRQIGLRVEVEDGAYVLYIANASDWMKHVLRDTLYARGVRTVLQSLPGVAPGPLVRFHTGLVARTTRVPIGVLD